MPTDQNNPRMPEDMKRAIARLREKFKDDAENRILYIESALSDFRDGNDRMEAANRITVAAHSIAGLAPSLGFENLGVQASQTEQLWDRAIEQNLSDTILKPALDATEDLMDQLEATLEPIGVAN